MAKPPKETHRARAPDDEPDAVAKKALTLRLKIPDYRRLRRYAADNLTTHQDVLEAALDNWLRDKGY
jgi:hypothetical protein